MADLVGLLKEIMALTSSVGELKSDVRQLAGKVENHAERILLLENREELLAEKMTNAALKAVFEMTGQYFSRLAAVEQRLGLDPPKNIQQLES